MVEEKKWEAAQPLPIFFLFFFFNAVMSSEARHPLAQYRSVCAEDSGYNWH